MSTQTQPEAAAPAGVTPSSGGGGRGFLSDVIVELGFATRETVEEAVRAARSPGTTVPRALVESGAISEEQLARATAERHGFDYIDLEGFDVDPAAANLIKPTAARRYLAVPVCFLDQTLLVAMADPADTLGVNDIAVMTKLEVRPAVAARPALDELLGALPLDEAEGGGPRPAPVPAAEKPASSAVFWQEGAGGELPATDLEEGLDSATEQEELREAEMAELRAKLTEAEAELAAARAEADSARADADSARADAESARADAESATGRAEVAEALNEELRDADSRAEQARQALIAGREESEREREQWAITERDLRDQLSDVEKRRGELEERLSEVEGSAFAAERAFEELRLAQGRMRDALRELAGP